MNNFSETSRLFETLSKEEEVHVLEKDEDGEFELKQSPIIPLNQYVNSILKDMDPENEVEEEDKHKKDQVFCWRYLRQVSYTDQNNFQSKNASGTMVPACNIDIEKLTALIHEQAMKKELPKPEKPQVPEPAKEVAMALAEAPKPEEAAEPKEGEAAPPTPKRPERSSSPD